MGNNMGRCGEAEPNKAFNLTSRKKRKSLGQAEFETNNEKNCAARGLSDTDRGNHTATRTSFTKLLRANRCFRGSRLTWGTTWVLVAKQNLTKHSIKQQVKQKTIVGDKGQSELQTNKQKTVRQSKQELSRLLNEQQTKNED